MNEQACAVVCAIFSVICTILSCYAAVDGDWQVMVIAMTFAGIVCLLAGFVLVCKYL